MSENALIVRFRIYAPNGGSLGILPHPLSWEAGLPFNDMSSLTMTYPDGSDAANLLKKPCEVALELRNPRTGTFAEYPGCRFLNIKQSVNLASRPRVMSFTMPSYGWQLKKARFLSSDNTRLNKEKRIVYKTDVGPGLILKNLLDEAKARQNITGMSYTFNGSVDSAGSAWAVLVSGEFDLGQDAWSIVDAFARQGLIDWWFNKREFEIFRPSTYLERRLDTDTGVHLHSMLAMTEEPVERTWEENAGHLLVMGDGRTTRLIEASGAADLPWGKWDEAFSTSGVMNRAMMDMIGQYMLGTKYKSRAQLTKRMVWTEGAPVPLVDYRQGDYVRARDDTGSQKAGLRVHQITLSGVEPYGVAIAVTLNDRFTERSLQMERWITRITGSGGPVGGGGTGGGTAKPLPPPADSVRPKPPQNVQVTNSPYFSELGEPVARADVSFEVVTEDVQGNEIDMARYNVAARRADHSFHQARIVQVPHPASASAGQRIHAFVPLLDSGYTYYFSVQSIRQSGYGSDDWSPEVAQTMGYPTAAPKVPSAPLVSSKLGTVKAEWDGKDSTGAAYATSLREVQVEVSVDGTAWFHVGDIGSPGSSVILSGKGGMPTWKVGDTVQVRFRARNSASVISAPSAVSSVGVVGVEGPDIAANAVTANHVAAGSLTAEQIQAHSLSVETLSVGDPQNLIVDPAFTSATLNAHRIKVAQDASVPGNVWEVTDAGALRFVNANPGTVSYNRFAFVNNTGLTYPVHTFPGPKLRTPELAIPVTRPFHADDVAGNILGRFTLTSTGLPSPIGAVSVKVSLMMRAFDRKGNSLSFAPIIVQETQVTSNQTVTIQSQEGAAIPAGVVAVIPYFYIALEGSAPGGITLSFSDVEIWREGSVTIGANMITAPMISANAITADKLAANAITAKHSILSAYYEMRSQLSGSATVKITQSANYVGHAGILWDGLQPSTGVGPRIFQTDTAGLGGWDPRGMVISGPEQTADSSGRIDIQLSYGVANTYFKRSYGSETFSVQGIFWDTSVARFRIGGMFNTGHYANDMFRFDRMQFQNGTYAYSVVTTRRYYPIITPNGDTTPVTSSILDFPNGTEGGFRWVSSTGTTEIFFLALCGTP